MILLIVPYSYLWRFHSDNKPTITWRKKVKKSIFFRAIYICHLLLKEKVSSLLQCLYFAYTWHTNFECCRPYFHRNKKMFISIILVLSLFLVIVVINEQLDNCSTRCGHLGQWHQWTSGPVQQEVVILGRLLGGFSAWKDTPAAFTIAWVFHQLVIINTVCTISI